MKIREKLMMIQNDLKVEKKEFNKFGKFGYRRLDQILEACKPLFIKYRVAYTLESSLVKLDGLLIRKTKGVFMDVDSDDTIKVEYDGQEALTKAGMAPEQCSGSAHSYNGKYITGGLFCLDDTADADSMDNTVKTTTEKPKAAPKKPVDKPKFTLEEKLVNESQLKVLQDLCNQIDGGEERILAYILKINKRSEPYFSLKELNDKDFVLAKSTLEKQVK